MHYVGKCTHRSRSFLWKVEGRGEGMRFSYGDFNETNKLRGFHVKTIFWDQVGDVFYGIF